MGTRKVLVLAMCTVLIAGHATGKEAAVQRMIGTLEGAHTVSVDVVRTYDHQSSNAQRIQRTSYISLVMERPLYLYGTYKGDLGDFEFRYTGQDLVLVSHSDKEFSVLEAPGSIDRALDVLQEHYDSVFPLAELITSNFGQRLSEEIVWSDYIGLSTVDQVPAYHHLFKGQTIDLELWLATEDHALPSKARIRYWSQVDEPTETYEFTDWSINEDVDQSIFHNEMPDSYLFVERVRIGIPE